MASGGVAFQQLDLMPDCHPLGRCLTSLAEHWLCSVIRSCITHRSRSAISNQGHSNIGHSMYHRCKQLSLICPY